MSVVHFDCLRDEVYDKEIHYFAYGFLIVPAAFVENYVIFFIYLPLYLCKK